MEILTGRNYLSINRLRHFKALITNEYQIVLQKPLPVYYTNTSAREANESPPAIEITFF